MLDQEPTPSAPAQVERPSKPSRSSGSDHHRAPEIVDPLSGGVNDSVRLYLQEIW